MAHGRRLGDRWATVASIRGPGVAAAARHLPSLSVRAIVGAYVVAALAWIALSDVAVATLIPAPARTLVETAKGWGFVAVTGSLLLLLLRRYDAQRARQADELAARESRFRLLAEHAQDVIFRFQIDRQVFDYVSPAVGRVLGRGPEDFYADPDLLYSLVHPDDRSRLDLVGGTWRDPRPMLLRVRHAAGHWVSLEQRSHVVVDALGAPVAVEGVARDVTEQRRADLALARQHRVERMLRAVNQALVRAEDEQALLEAICAAAIGGGGFRFAWVGYREDDEAGTLRPVAHAGHEAGYLDALHLSWHDTKRGRGPAGVAVREGQPAVSRDIAADPNMAPWATAALERGYASLAALPLRQDGEIIGVLAIYAGEPDAFEDEEMSLLEELAADLSYGIAALRTKARGAAADAERRHLAAAIEQSAESVIVTDVAGRIEYVNPAFERVTGYSRDEVLGRNPRILQSGEQGRSFYEAMWQTLTGGTPWAGDFVNRRKDGSLIVEEAVISPVRDGSGQLTGYVGVKRDVTRERNAQAEDQTRARERALVAQALAGLHPHATPEETAAAMCAQIVALPEAAVASLLAFEPDGQATPLGSATADGRPIEQHRVPVGRTQHLRTRALEGPWVEIVRGGDSGPFSRALQALGVRALAYAPVRIDRDVVGLLEVGSASPQAAETLTERLPALFEFASIASAALGPAISSRAQLVQARERIRSIIERRAFHPVFQPIVDLASLAVVGYEALTRFEDGTPPDVQFREAAAVGLGVELECAALEAALREARSLSATPWLNVNASPAAILAGEPLRSIIASYEGHVVLEVTEHDAITDYHAFRAAVAALGRDVRIAVDDAGAGFASLRHIVELRPHIVKIDRSLVADIDADPARQALLTGLRRFADTQGCSLIAEGIETEEERATLVGLEVQSGQGYLFGRPVPVLGGNDGHARSGAVLFPERSSEFPERSSGLRGRSDAPRADADRGADMGERSA